MKRTLLFLVVLFLFILFISCAPSGVVDPVDPDPVPTAASPDTVTTVSPPDQQLSWRDLSRRRRNDLIVSRAIRDVGLRGGQCKTWIRTVVTDVSDGAVHLPSNDPVQYHLWQQSDAVSVIAERIDRADPGNIVQMWLVGDGYSGPHTSIVARTTRDSVTFVDSNFGWDEVVRIRRVSYFSFHNAVRLFTIYRVN